MAYKVIDFGNDGVLRPELITYFVNKRIVGIKLIQIKDEYYLEIPDYMLTEVVDELCRNYRIAFHKNIITIYNCSEN